MRILLVGPVTGLPRFNAEAFERAATELRAQGHIVVSPLEIDVDAGLNLSGPPPALAWIQEARRRCLAVLVAGDGSRIEACVCLVGWWMGFGRVEVEIARALGIKVLSEDMQPIEQVEL